MKNCLFSLKYSVCDIIKNKACYEIKHLRNAHSNYQKYLFSKTKFHDLFQTIHSFLLLALTKALILICLFYFVF